MKIAITGGSGFIGHYLLRQFLSHGHQLKCWRRTDSKVQDLPAGGPDCQWIEGNLKTCDTAGDLVQHCHAVIHNAFWRPGSRFQGEEGEIAEFVQTNLVGTLKLIEAAKKSGVKQFLFVSSCAVHDKILNDRRLDENHPLFPSSHYGAHKAAVEKFVHSYARSEGFNIGVVRPTGVYGLHHQLSKSKWFELIRNVMQGKEVFCGKGGKEVHANDVAKSMRVLLERDEFQGEVFACYDRYISEYDVAHLAKEISGSDAKINGHSIRPKNQIDTEKIRGMGMVFGGDELLRKTVNEIVAGIDASGEKSPL